VTAPLLPQDTLWLLQALEQGQRCGNLTNFANSCSLLTSTMHVLLYRLTAKTCTHTCALCTQGSWMAGHTGGAHLVNYCTFLAHTHTHVLHCAGERGAREV